MADFDRALEVLFTAVSNLPERWEAGSYGVRCK
jgi:hypothetical protein